MTSKPQILAALLAMTVGASAGYKWPVGVDAHIRTDPDGTSFVSGALSAVRGTADTTQYLGCSVSSYEGGARMGQCNVRNAQGVYRACSTQDPALLEEMRHLKGDSHLSFRANADGSCGFVQTSNHSHYGAKQ